MIPNNAAPLALALLGLMLGMRHATDADHVVAVTTIVSTERRLAVATRVGIAWGLGHLATIMLVGAAIIFLKLKVPPRLGLAMEFTVALVLVGLGLSTLRRSAAMGKAAADEPLQVPTVHSHSHAHQGLAHSHPHLHPPGSADRHEDHRMALKARAAARWVMLRALGVGFAHGLAGSAAIALLVLGAIPQPIWAILYLMLFGLGTVLGMILITTAIGIPVVLTAGRLSGLNRTLALGSGLLSLGFGLVLAYQIGVTQSLFGSIPLWTPH